MNTQITKTNGLVIYSVNGDVTLVKCANTGRFVKLALGVKALVNYNQHKAQQCSDKLSICAVSVITTIFIVLFGAMVEYKHGVSIITELLSYVCALSLLISVLGVLFYGVSVIYYNVSSTDYNKLSKGFI